MRWLAVTLVLALAVAWAAGEGGGKASTRLVQVREAHLREKPSYLGRILKRLPYETEVAVEEEPKDSSWLKVRIVKGGARGWLAASAVTPSAAALKAGSGGAEDRAGRTTRSLAGRGFNADVEKARRQGLRASGSEVEAGYRKLDALLARPPYTCPPEAVPAFVRDGQLGGGR